MNLRLLEVRYIRAVLFLIFRSESTCVIHIPDGFILYHYLTGNAVNCQQKQRGGRRKLTVNTVVN